MKLAVNHVAHGRIITANNCDPVTQYAAEELARWLGEITGAAFPINSDSLPPQANDILVGENSRTAAYAAASADSAEIPAGRRWPDCCRERHRHPSGDAVYRLFQD